MPPTGRRSCSGSSRARRPTCGRPSTTLHNGSIRRTGARSSRRSSSRCFRTVTSCHTVRREPRMPVSIAYTEQSDTDAVDAALRAELAGGPATGFEPSDEDGGLGVAFWTSTVHTSWPTALSRGSLTGCLPRRAARRCPRRTSAHDARRHACARSHPRDARGVPVLARRRRSGRCGGGGLRRGGERPGTRSRSTAWSSGGSSGGRRRKPTTAMRRSTCTWTRSHGRGVGADAVRTLARHLITAHGHHRIEIDPRPTTRRRSAATPRSVPAGRHHPALRARRRRHLARRSADGLLATTPTSDET